MKRRWKILIGTGIFLVVMAASGWVTLHVRPANAVESYKKYLRDKGEKLEISEVLPPPVAPEDNSVKAMEAAFGMFGSSIENVPNAMQMVAPGKALIAWQQPDVRNYDFTNSWDEFAAGVVADRPAIELLHQILERPKLDFQLDYKQGAKLLLPHLALLKRSAQKLTAAAVLEMHNGDCGAAATNILTLLALAHRDTRDEMLISHLVRFAITAIAVAPTWELLQATNVSEAQLASVQKGWQQIDFLNEAENALVMERAWTSAEIQQLRASHEQFEESVNPYDAMSSSGSSSSGGWGWPPNWDAITEGPRLAVAETMWRFSWSYSAELNALKNNQVILEALRSMQTNQSRFYKADYDAMSSRLSSLGVTNTSEAFFRALKIPDLRGYFGDGGLKTVVRKTLQIEAERNVVITAIALKRFQLKHDKWPETLGTLAPEFLPSVPIDPYDGKPLKYHPNADGTYLLYSVGEDGVDDGGDTSPAKPSSPVSSTGWYWLRARDWAWPQPASSAEVQYFYEHPAR